MQVFQKRKDGVWRNAISACLTGEERGVFLASLRESPYPQGIVDSGPLLIFWVVDGCSG